MVVELKTVIAVHILVLSIFYSIFLIYYFNEKSRQALAILIFLAHLLTGFNVAYGMLGAITGFALAVLWTLLVAWQLRVLKAMK